MSIKTKLSTVVSKQLPEFVREDHPTFVAFIEAYYEYMATQQPRTLETIRDIDESLDSFIINFKNELDINGRYFSDVPITERYFLKNIKQLYTSKGSLASYNLLFRILFNKDVELRYPSKSMLRVSDGKWKQEYSLFVRTSAGDVNTIVNNNVFVVKTIGNSVRTIKLFVNKIKFIRTGIYEVFFTNTYNGILDVGSSITFGAYAGEILKTISGYTIQTPGKNFKVGQLLNINVVVGLDTLKCISKIITINADGGIKTIAILKFNGGYDDGSFNFIAQPVKTTPLTNTSSIRIDLGAPGTHELLTIPSATATLGSVDYGYISKPDYWSDYSDQSYTGDIIQSFYTENFVELDNTSSNDAVISFDLGAVAKYPGYYIANDGFVSDKIYIQDSKYYQAFSYVIRADEALSRYNDLVKSYLHPSGTSMFAEYVLSDSFDLTLQAQSQIGFGSIKLTELLVISDVIDNTVILLNSLADSINISDDMYLTRPTMEFADTQSVTDTSAGNSIIVNPYVEYGHVVLTDDYVDVNNNF